MLPYLIAGAIGYGIAKLLEDDKASKYVDGGEVKDKDDVNVPLYHGTIKEIWKNSEYESYLYVTYDFEFAKSQALDRAIGEDGTPIVVKIYPNQIKKYRWEVDDDMGVYRDLHTWQDSYNKIGSFVIIGEFDIDNFQIIDINRFEDDKAPKYADGGYIKNIKKLYEEDGSDVYGGDFGEAGGLNWRINKEQDYLYLMGIGRNNRGSNEGKSKGEGSRAIAYLFNLYPKLDVIYFEIDGEEDAWQFYKKIGAEEEGGGEITEHTYNAQITRKSIKKYFENKDIPFSFNNGGLIAPNGQPSNLTPEQYKLVRTPAFKKWFGDWEKDPANASKVVDSNGEPMVVYHGTNNQFNVFKPTEYKRNFGTIKSNAFFFAKDKIVAEYIAELKSDKNSKKIILPVFLNIRNLLDFADVDIVENVLPSIIGDLPEDDLSENMGYLFYVVEDKENSDKIKKMNYDGVQLIEGYLMEQMEDLEGDIIESYAVFKPNQIKLADGTNTTFDSNNPDIRYAGGGSVEELKFSNEIESDAMGYEIGEYLYHITPVSNFNTIINKGFIPKNGISINGKPFENRLYFATSLISAYDLSINFGSYRDDAEYVIFKIKSDCINDYEEDNLFAHGIYVDYRVSNKCIVGYVNANDLFNKFDDEDLENLYY